MNLIASCAIPTNDVWGMVGMVSVRECFAANLKRLLQERNLTQKAFAKMIESTETSVSRWLQAKELPISQTIDLICQKLEVLPGTLFDTPNNTDTLPGSKIVLDLRKLAEESGFKLIPKDS
jgi:transcriptional regulator with XRE-family HTH domain